MTLSKFKNLFINVINEIEGIEFGSIDKSIETYKIFYRTENYDCVQLYIHNFENLSRFFVAIYTINFDFYINDINSRNILDLLDAVKRSIAYLKTLIG